MRLRVDLSPDVSIGPGKIALLEGIARTGSLSAAARDLGMSYRRGWLLVHSVNEAFRPPVVQFSTGGRHGGGAKLTAFGRTLIHAFRALETATDRLAHDDFGKLLRELSKSGGREIDRRAVRKKSR